MLVQGTYLQVGFYFSIINMGIDILVKYIG